MILFGSEKYDFIYNRLRYLIGIINGVTYVISHNYTKIKANLFDSLPLEKTMAFYNVIILSKSVFDKDKNNYYYNIFLEKVSYELPKKISFFIKYKCYIMIELTFLEEVMLMRQLNQKTTTFLAIGIF